MTHSTKTYLKLKIKSLAAEAKLEKFEERKWITKDGKRNHPIRLGVMDHRKQIVRPEARIALLAYGYLRGRAYLQLEAKAYTAPNWGRVAVLVEKYGGGNYVNAKDALKEWITKQP